MGVDVNLYAIGEITDNEIVTADVYLKGRCDVVPWRADEPVARRNDYHADRVDFMTGYRYYGPGYERGPWPTIYACIRALQGAFPTCVVFYGGDTSEEGFEATDAEMQRIWGHWLRPDFNAYREGR